MNQLLEPGPTEAQEEWTLKLYIAGQTPKSIAAFTNLKDFCERHLAGRYRLEIVDLQVLNMMEGGNQVAVTFVLEANLPAWGGGHYRDEEIHLWTFDDDGKVVGLRHYTDTAKHIAAAKINGT